MRRNLNNLKRYFNQNTKAILTVIGFIAFIIIIIQVLNNMTKASIEEQSKQAINNKNSNNIENTSNYSKSIISNQEIGENTYKEQSNIIDNFINYCNNGDVQNAYNLLSNDCKKEMFPKLEDFRNNYYDKVFNSKKSYSIQNWSNSTYKVRIKKINNMLATGKVGNNEAIEDYYTVVYRDNEYKLNINNFIGTQAINAEEENQNIKIKVINKKTYMDYEIYNINVKNDTKNYILLDTKETTKGMYVKDSKDVKYPSYSHEIVDSSLIIPSGGNRDLTIKYTNSFVVNRKIQYLVFSDIILDYYKYKDTSDKTQYKDRLKIEAEI